jgi:TrmH RNA methyltransferase
MKNKAEILIYGNSAVDAVWLHRRHDIVRAYCTHDMAKKYGALLKWCAKERKAYHMVTSEELVSVTKATHHQGLALLVKLKPILDEEQFFQRIEKNAQSIGPLLYLDGVENSHNLGAIQRTLAHFGGKFLVGEKNRMPMPSGSWIRLSSGGYEFVDLVMVDDGAVFLERLKQQRGFDVVALSNRATTSLFSAKISSRVAMIFGNEVHGVSDAITQIADHHCVIPGAGVLDSLNVSVAVGICVAEWARSFKR